jgi:hypothetical protein
LQASNDGDDEMKTTIDMAREVYGAHTEWSGAPLERLEQLVALVRADEREQGQKWFDAVTAQNKQLILAERSACAKVCQSEADRALWNFQNDLSQNESFWNGAEQMASSCENLIKTRSNI